MQDIPLFTFGEGEPRLCAVSDFAKANGVPVQTLYSATSSGRIVHVRRNGRLYLNIESAEHYMTVYRKLNPTPKES